MKYAFILMLCALLSACNQQVRPEPEKTVSAVQQRPLGDDEVLSRISVLPPQRLEAGECGMFLWLKREDAPLVLFQKARSQTAVMSLEGGLLTLERSSAEGPVMSVFFERQRFSEGGFTASLTIRAERDAGIRNGLKVSSGSLSLSAGDGWSAALPIVGVIGCQ